MKTIEAVVWDLDGTLLNTLADLHAATNYALTSCGLPEQSIQAVRSFVGNGAAKLIQRAVPIGTPPQQVAAVFDTFRRYYTAHHLQYTTPYPGIPEGLATLKAWGIPMAVVSNKIQPAVEALRQHFFADTIPVAVGDIPGRPVKPAPDSTLAALQQLGVPPERALFVGDSDVDFLTARHAGMMSLSAAWGFRDADFLRQQGANVIAHTPSEAIAYIMENIKREGKVTP